MIAFETTSDNIESLSVTTSLSLQYDAKSCKFPINRENAKLSTSPTSLFITMGFATVCSLSAVASIEKPYPPYQLSERHKSFP